MALRNQPYIPLYVQDYLTNQKLNMCSAASQGIYVKIMCQMHKSDEYGTILLKQNRKQNSSTYLNFAYVLARLLPFDKDELKLAIQELVEEKVLYIENDRLCQKRMIHDNKISELRAESGAKGGIKTQKEFAKAKLKQNTEYENEYENESNIINIEFEKFWDLYDKKVSKEKTVKLWNKLNDNNRELIMDYIPKYKEAQPDKSWRKNPDVFLRNSAWEDEIVTKQPTDNRGTRRQAVMLSEEDKEQYK